MLNVWQLITRNILSINKCTIHALKNNVLLVSRVCINKTFCSARICLDRRTSMPEKIP